MIMLLFSSCHRIVIGLQILPVNCDLLVILWSGRIFDDDDNNTFVFV